MFCSPHATLCESQLLKRKLCVNSCGPQINRFAPVNSRRCVRVLLLLFMSCLAGPLSSKGKKLRKQRPAQKVEKLHRAICTEQLKLALGGRYLFPATKEQATGSKREVRILQARERELLKAAIEEEEQGLSFRIPNPRLTPTL